MSMIKETLLGVLMLIAGVGTLVALIIIPENPTLWGSGIGLFLSMGLVLGYEKKQGLLFWWQHTKKLKLLSTLLTANMLFIAIGLVNYLAYKKPWVRDFSQGQWMSLSDESSQLISKIKEKKWAMTLYLVGKKEQFPAIRELLELYRLEYPLMNIEVVDSDLRPSFVEDWKIKGIPSVGLEINGKRYLAEEINEWGISKEIKKALAFKVKKIALVRDLALFGYEEESEMGQKKFFQFLTRMNLEPSVVELQSLSVSDLNRFDIVLMLGPIQHLNPKESDKLKAFIAQKEKIFAFALDAMTDESFISSWQTHLLGPLGLTWEKGHVIDKKSFVQGSAGSVPMVTTLKDMTVAKGFKGALFFPLPAAVRLDKSWSVVAETSELSYHEEDWGEGKNLEQSTEAGASWPLFAWRAGNGEQGTVIYLGPGRLWQDQYAEYAHHFQLLGNIFEYAEGQKELMTFSRPDFAKNPVLVNEQMKMILMMLMIIVFPLCLGIASLLTFRRGASA
jgi:hypothetical protein